MLGAGITVAHRLQSAAGSYPHNTHNLPPGPTFKSFTSSCVWVGDHTVDCCSLISTLCMPEGWGVGDGYGGVLIRSLGQKEKVSPLLLGA